MAATGVELSAPEPRLPDEEGDRVGAEPSGGEGYRPQDGELRDVAWRQIRVRRGQQQFRDALRTSTGTRVQ